VWLYFVSKHVKCGQCSVGNTSNNTPPFRSIKNLESPKFGDKALGFFTAAIWFFLSLVEYIPIGNNFG
jgi:hypothetical protein